MSEDRIVSSGSRIGSMRVPNGVSKETFIKILETPMLMADLGIKSVKLIDDKTVRVVFSGIGDMQKDVNISGDSKGEIINDIIKAVK